MMLAQALSFGRFLACLLLFFGRQFAAAWIPSSKTNCARRDVRCFAFFSAQDDSDTSGGSNRVLYSLLSQFGFDRRLKFLHSQDLPVLAEVYVNGKSELCTINAFRPTNDPVVEIKLLSGDGGDTCVADFGQITTIWETKELFDPDFDLIGKLQEEYNRFPVGSIETALDELYNSHVGRARSASDNTLTKKQIGKFVSQIPSEKDRQHSDSVLRQLIKAGSGCSRLVDSEITATFLYDLKNRKVNNLQQAFAAKLLAEDADVGGRFKRMPCTFIEKQPRSGRKVQETVESVVFINGGWMVVDQSVRAGAEARKFAEKVQSSQKAVNAETVAKKPQTGWTISDQRIAQRLECLAMGDIFKSEATAETDLEVDVREALKALGAPATPEGARNVLVKIGRWTEGQCPSDQKSQVQPWSQTILEAAEWYHQKQLSSTKADALKAGYSDMTQIPFVCVDQQRTSFRDDAIGVRPRAGTGREVMGKSRWEVLVAIADVSEIYTETARDDVSSMHLNALRQAAASRAVSRYDLPFGPLHLMPPVALQALTFSTVGPSGKHDNGKSWNRCVTLWVYIDEQSGEVLDAGIERSIISPPIALSYQDATGLLDGKIDTSQNSIMRRSGQILGVAERGIMPWNEQRRQNSEAAEKREQRLAVKEFATKQRLLSNDHKNRPGRGDGQEGFQRTRGHKLVDASLDLYSSTVTALLRRRKAPFPQQAGSGQSRGGRVATSPLRRYVDGMAQRQLLSVLCGYGSPPMTKAECQLVSKEATDAYNTVSNIRSVKKLAVTPGSDAFSQMKAVRTLEMHLAGGTQKVVPAVGTGRGNEVVIKGVGALAKCKGVKGNLKHGEEILVQVNKIDIKSGNVGVSLAP